jgi:hypothetical protein
VTIFDNSLLRNDTATKTSAYIYSRKIQKVDLELNMKKIISKINLLSVLVLFAAFAGRTWSAVEVDSNKEWERVLDLRGQWKFELGDNMKWSLPTFDDSDWDNIFVPSPWENEGFPGYDGFAWYRIHFDFTEQMKRHNLYLRLGFIDDVDEVYVNGRFLGYKGTFPPNNATAYQQERIYYLPLDFLNNTGDNVIAVRVHDRYNIGGIVKGVIGIYQRNSYLNPEYDLSGIWKFKKGDETEWEEENYNDSDWEDVYVPSFWAAYGLKDYDGYAWYRKTFIIPANLKDERLILLLGKIDDLDETYLNGHKIGQTGKIYDNPDRINIGDVAFSQDRAYTIPSSYLNENGVNQLAVRVYDGLLHGGIYDGPIGLVTREQYMDWQRKFDRDDNIKHFFMHLFNN